MHPFDKGHLKLRHGIVVEPHKDQHEDWDEPSNKGYGIENFGEAPEVIILFVSEYVGHPEENISFISVGIVRQPRLLGYVDSFFAGD